METIQTDIQRIYNCKNNHPRNSIRVDYRAVTTWDKGMILSTEYVDMNNNSLDSRVVNNMKCSRCGEYMKQNDVFAVYNEESPCDLRCMHAIGAKCVCSCGGPNHGITWRVNN